MQPATPAAFVIGAKPAPRSWLLWLMLVLIPAPWLSLLLSGTVSVVLASEPAWVQDLVAGQLVALAVFTALGGSAWAWRRIFDERGFFAQAVVGSHALFLVVLGFSA